MISPALMALLALSLHGTPQPNASRLHRPPKPVEQPKPPPPQDKPSQDKPDRDAPPPEKQERDQDSRQQLPQYREPPYLAVIRKNMSQIEGCYDRARAWRPTLQGEVVVEFEISSDGSVERAQIAGNTTGDTELAGCVLQAVKLWRFPDETGENPRHVRHPFRFQAP